MIDRKKVLIGLECCIDLNTECRDCPYFNRKYLYPDCEITMMQSARDLLKADQERKPVKPEVEHSGGGSTWWNVCGACRTAINPNDKYCHECGVSIDWRPDDDRTD